MKRGTEEAELAFTDAKASRWSSQPPAPLPPPLPAPGPMPSAPAPLGSMMAPPMTISSSGRYEQLVVFTREQIGCIIGKAGSVVKRIRETTGAWVTINKDDGTDTREVTVSGSSLEQMQLALSECIKAAGEAKAPGAPAGPDAGVVITIPPSMVGRVIGKGGDMIRKIQTSTGATLKISNEPAPGTTDRTVTFSGSDAGVQAAIEMVQKIMADAPPSMGPSTSVPTSASFAPPSYGIDPATGYPSPPPGYILVPALPPPPGYTPPPGFLCVAAPQQPQIQYAPNPYVQQYAPQQFMAPPQQYAQMPFDPLQYAAAEAPMPAPLALPPPPEGPPPMQYDGQPLAPQFY